MRVPLLDLSEQYRALADPIREAIDDVLTSQPIHPWAESGGVREGHLRLLQGSPRYWCFIGNRCFPGHFDGAWNRARRCRRHNAVHIFCHRRMHRAGWREAAFRRYRSGDLQLSPPL